MASALSIVRKHYPKVTKVVNARGGVVLEVNENDLKLAAKNMKDHKACAIATACKQHLGAEGAIVSTRTMYLINGTTATRYLVSTRAATELVSYDRGAGFTAGTYSLLKPPRQAPRGSGTRHAGDPRPGKLKHRKLARSVRAAGIRSALNA